MIWLSHFKGDWRNSKTSFRPFNIVRQICRQCVGNWCTFRGLLKMKDDQKRHLFRTIKVMVKKLSVGIRFLDTYQGYMCCANSTMLRGCHEDVTNNVQIRQWIGDYCLMYSMFGDFSKIAEQEGQDSALTKRRIVALWTAVGQMELQLLRQARILVADEDGVIQKFVDECWGGKGNPPPLVANRLARTIELEMRNEFSAALRGAQLGRLEELF